MAARKSFMQSDAGNAVLLALAVLLSLLVVELVGRLLAEPCESCWGQVLGMELPPFDVIPDTDTSAVDRGAPFGGLIVDGDTVTIDDLWGINREDSLLGYAPLESSRSANGWWQTNSVGARAGTETDSLPPANTSRVLAFGDSFAIGSRVRQEETWSYQADLLQDDFEVVNFGVDGYSLAQAYLRYQDVSNRIAYDWIIVLFPPSTTLARDVNVSRSLFGWGRALPGPRFVVEDDGLRLIRGPYSSMRDMLADNADGVNPEFVNYLRRYDAFYLRTKYERPPIVGDLFVYKLIARFVFRLQERRLLGRLLRETSEAMTVSRAILSAWSRTVNEKGGRMLIAYLPARADVTEYGEKDRFRKGWDRIVSGPCPERASCLDLMGALRRAPREQVDAGYDGTHYGPRGNGILARAIVEEMSRERTSERNP